MTLLRPGSTAVDPLDHPLNNLRDSLMAAAQRTKENTMKAPESIINDVLYQEGLRPTPPEVEHFGRNVIAALLADGYHIITRTTCPEPGCEYAAGHEQEHPHGRRSRCDNGCGTLATVRVQLPDNHIKDVCEPCAAAESGDPEFLEATDILADARRGDTLGP